MPPTSSARPGRRAHTHRDAARTRHTTPPAVVAVLLGGASRRAGYSWCQAILATLSLRAPCTRRTRSPHAMRVAAAHAHATHASAARPAAMPTAPQPRPALGFLSFRPDLPSSPRAMRCDGPAPKELGGAEPKPNSNGCGCGASTLTPPKGSGPASAKSLVVMMSMAAPNCSGGRPSIAATTYMIQGHTQRGSRHSARLHPAKGRRHDDPRLDVVWAGCVGHAPSRRPHLLSAQPGTPGCDTRLSSVHGRSATPPRRAAELQLKPRAGLNIIAPEHIGTHE